ncbi:MAG: hypothetical protein JST54_09235 [Deltaproteobacteria bacterium]|nr:hypothetical protein [Deltaproteobacteria bacterium]
MSALSDVGVVAAYFNPCGYRTKRENLERFADAVRAAGVPLVIAEAAFEGEDFSLPAQLGALRIRARDVMWQKERLLNVATSALPASCTKVAWLDADVLFARADWAEATSAALERYPIVQLFDAAVRLPFGHTSDRGEGERYRGFAAAYVESPQVLLSGDFARHGHTGFAWAARRELLVRHGLYDACIAGSGDHMMAHAFCGDWEGPCVRRILGSSGPHRAYFRSWSKRLYADVRARVGVVPGALWHLWHGEIVNRRYVLRNRELAAFDFDPARDLTVGPTGCWEWASKKPELHAWARDYFDHRREDEAPTSLERTA